ncbi:MAG: FecR domain-containing protein [Cytophagales bacterium]|nr:FecR domain-containing protein [Cytophagales bacterium]
MHQKEFDELLDRYTRGLCTPEEEKWIHAFFRSYQNEKKQWQPGEAQQARQEIYHRVRQQIHKKEAMPAKARPLWPVWLRVAAMVSIMVGFSWLAYRYVSGPQEVVLLTKTTARGHKAKIVLPDGTRVTLNAESSLVYPESFDGKNRQVELTGEGFFEVTSDPSKPFLVQSPDFTTTVLGTVFNISAYDEEPASVTVQEGKVQVTHSQDFAEMVVLTAREQAVLSSTGLTKKSIDSDRHFAWKDGIIYLDRTTLRETASLLERWYDVDIRFANPGLAGCTMNGKFHNDQLINILKSLAHIKGFQFEFLDERTILITGESC